MNKKVYIEAGAVDGIFNSRTLHYKNNKDYFGILIEPNPHTFKRLVANRTEDNVILVHAALVSKAYEQKTIKLRCHAQEACTHVSLCQENRRTDQWNKHQEEVEVPTMTLQSILDQNNITEIEWLYLDVEGYEEEVLNGLDYNKIKINNAEIEVHGTKWPEHLEAGKQLFIPLMKDRFNLELLKVNHEVGCPNLIFGKK